MIHVRSAERDVGVGEAQRVLRMAVRCAGAGAPGAGTPVRRPAGSTPVRRAWRWRALRRNRNAGRRLLGSKNPGGFGRCATSSRWRTATPASCKPALRPDARVVHVARRRLLDRLVLRNAPIAAATEHRQRSRLLTHALVRSLRAAPFPRRGLFAHDRPRPSRAIRPLIVAASAFIRSASISDASSRPFRFGSRGS